MKSEVTEIELIILVGSILSLSLVSFIIVFLFFYQKRYFIQEKKIAEIREQASKEILKAQLEIREITLKSVGQEIHDNSGQLLSLIKLNSNMLLEKLYKGDAMEELLIENKSLITEAITDLRNLSRNISSETIEHLGFESAFRNQIEKLKKSNHYDCHFSLIGNAKRLSIEKEIILFRMTQEILQNIMKHSKAIQIFTKLIFEPNQLIVEISDDGIGFNYPESIRSNPSDKGSGIFNLESRAKLIGAILQIVSKPSKGTKITIQLSI